MANQEGMTTKTGIAGTAIVRGRFVVLASDGQMDHVGTTSTISPDGVAVQAQATVGQPFSYAKPDHSTVPVMIGAAITRGGLVMSDGAGKAIPFVDAVGNIACGRAMSTGANDGEFIEIAFGHYKTGAGS